MESIAQIGKLSQLAAAQVRYLKLLCLRTTGHHPELEYPYEAHIDGTKATRIFASWAFRTFPCLLFIAFGDFSYGRRAIGNSEILRRHPFPEIHSENDISSHAAAEYPSKSAGDGFRKLRKNDGRYEEYLDQFRDVLEACPAGPLYKKDF